MPSSSFEWLPAAAHSIENFGSNSNQVSRTQRGAIHARKQAADARRDRKLQRAGFRIVRVSAELVLSDLSAAIAIVRAAL